MSTDMSGEGHSRETVDDVLEAVKFDDGIARSRYPVDIHSPTGEGTVIQRLPPGEYYEVPYRCLLPQNVDNLLIGSRCVSSTHEAHSSLRVMPVVAGIGEAAGPIRGGLEDARVQDDFFDKRYFQPAMAWGEDKGFSLPLSALVIYDSFIHSGSILYSLRQPLTDLPPANGEHPRKGLVQGTKMGHIFLLDRLSGELTIVGLLDLATDRDQVAERNSATSRRPIRVTG